MPGGLIRRLPFVKASKSCYSDTVNLKKYRVPIIIVVFAISLLAPDAGSAVEPCSGELVPVKLKVHEVADIGKGTPELRAANAGEDAGSKSDQTPALKTKWGTGFHKSYLIPALEIPGFILFLNGFDRLAHGNETEGGKRVYNSTPSTFWKHVTRGPWGFDQDSFDMNQFLHPLAGSIYYGFARSAGLNYWESLGYTFAGSFLWETAGETTPPSVNDQIASGIAGTFLGEPLYRMANLLLEKGDGKPGLWHEVGAAVLSPSTGFNRLVFGDRFKPVLPSYDPAIFWQLQLGASKSSQLRDEGGSSILRSYVASATFSMDYGLPGKPGYEYKRPFDYFRFEFTALSSARNYFENIMTRGLLLGREYEVGDSYRGVWGLYGSYDYISPHNFRVSSTAASLGTTGQWWLSRRVALQGSALAGVGYAAAGIAPGPGQRDYHYGIAAQGLLDLRLIFGEVTALDVNEREYYVSGLGATQPGSELIGRANAGITVRIYGRHALRLQYTASSRDAHYPDRPGRHQTVGAVNLVYTLLGDTRFGSVEWRDTAEARE